MLSSVLAIEIDGMTLRAAVIQKGWRGYTISDAHVLKREETADSEPGELPTTGELQQLLLRVGKIPRRVVLVSQQGTLVDISAPSMRVRKLRADQIKEMLSWEVEPYTGLTAPEVLVGYEIRSKSTGEQLEIEVTALAKSAYQELKELLLRQNIKLRRVYLPEHCFPLAILFEAFEGDEEQVQIVVDIGGQNTRVALINNGQVAAHRLVPLGYQAIRMHLDGLIDETLEPALLEALDWGTAVIKSATKVIICGSGSNDPGLLDFFKEHLKIPAEVLKILAAGDNDKEEFWPAEFAAVIGAGLRELGFAKMKPGVGIDDHIPLMKLIRERVHFFPIIVVTAILILFLGHYAYLSAQLEQVKTQTDLQAAELSEIKSATAQVQELTEKISSLAEKKELIEKKISFLEIGLTGQGQQLQLFLATLVMQKPAEITLQTVIPGDTSCYLVKGKSKTVSGVNILALRMQNQPWCYYARVESITRNVHSEVMPLVVEGTEPITIETISYEFKLTVNFVKDLAGQQQIGYEGGQSK